MIDLTFALRRYARWRLLQLGREDALRSQRRQLAFLLKAARSTRFGREHGFSGLRGIADYQRAVPLRRFDDFWREYWSSAFPILDNITWPGVIPFFANSSGTSSGVTKHVPVSTAMLRSNGRAAIDLLVHHLVNRPQSRLLGGQNFFLGGSPALAAVGPGVFEGDLSGIAAARVPLWAKGFYFPSGALARIADWEQKSKAIAKRSLQADIRSISGTPSWLLLFFDEVKRLRPDTPGRLVDFYPNLELLVHGGVSFAPYRERFAALLTGSHAETREVYPASEGFIALADRGPDEGLRLITDNGLFFEFVPVEELDSPSPTRHWLKTIETGVNYAIVLTTCAGLWSYVVGDTVRFVEKLPPRILVTGRTSYGLSAFGEHLIGEEIDDAVAAAAKAIGADVADFTTGPVFPEDGPGHHLYVVEFAAAVPPDAAEKFARALDRTLAARNADYAEHRAGDFGMGAPRAVFVTPGTFAAWMRSRGKLGGQNKVPRVVADAEAFQAVVTALRVHSTR